MKIQKCILTAVAMVGAMNAASAAEISGKVTLKGTAPEERTIEMDAMCGKLHTKPVTTRHYVVGADKGLANVFVYVKEGVTSKPAPPATKPMIDQVDCIYTPYISGVQAGQTFTVKNSDALMHNVHPTPKIAGNIEKNIAQPLKGMTTDFSFAKQEILLRFKCDVHNWMFAYVGVVDHPYFAVTDKDGNFKISGLPAGNYTVEAYHLKTHGVNPGVSEKVTVGAADTKAVNFTVEVK